MPKSLLFRILVIEVCLLVNGSHPPIYKDDMVASIVPPKPVILLGGLFPVHKNQNGTCGEILDLGFQRQEAMVFATRTINASPDILPDITLAFEIRDTCVLVNKALEESLPFVISHNISGVVGAASSSVSIAVANLMRLFNVPQISYASTAKVLSDKTRFEYFFRTVPPDSLQARAMADIIKTFNWTFVHTIYSDDAYGNEGIRAVLDELESDNNSKICIASSTKILPGTTDKKIFDEVVQKIDSEWSKNSTVVIIFGQLSTATGVLKAVKRKVAVDKSFANRITWIGSDAWGDQLTSDLHEVAKGMLSITPKAFLSKSFDRYFESLNPLNYSSNPWLREYWEFFFNCSFSGSHKRECDPANEAISSAGGYKQNSKVTFTIDAVYAFAHAIHNMISNLCHGKWPCPQIILRNQETVVIHYGILLNYLHNITFSGASSDTIAFDSSGDEEGDFLVKNLKENGPKGYYYETVGLWLHTQGLDFYRPIEWSTSAVDSPQSICSHPCKGGDFPEAVLDQPECCWTCKPCPSPILVSNGSACYPCPLGWKPDAQKTQCEVIIPNYLTWHDWFGVTVTIFSLILTAITIATMATFIRWRKHEIVVASSRELSAVLLTGILLCDILPFFFILKPSVFTCIIRRIGVGISLSLCYSAILVRSNRIYRIFNRLRKTTQKPALISPQSQLVFTFLLLSVQVAISAIWLALLHPGTVIVYTGFEAELKCKETSYTFLPITLGYNLVLLVLCCIHAYKSRHIPQNYNESKFINVTLYSTLIIWLAFVPSYFGAARFGTIFLSSSIVLGLMISSTTAIGCFFFPKLLAIFVPSCYASQEELIDAPINNQVIGEKLDMRRVSVSPAGQSLTRFSIEQMFPSKRSSFDKRGSGSRHGSFDDRKESYELSSDIVTGESTVQYSALNIHAMNHPIYYL